ncbi:hypothetical protein, partial [Bacteroides acidifaciens]|uniref:hypothetical protein n=2 Tax=Bacteroides TaxID=816 RepID=UPI0030155E61
TLTLKRKTMEKNIEHKVKPLTKKEQRVASGGYAPTDSPIKLIDDNNGMPDFKIPSKEDFKFY